MSKALAAAALIALAGSAYAKGAERPAVAFYGQERRHESGDPPVVPSKNRAVGGLR